jgi:hypothetical protein
MLDGRGMPRSRIPDRAELLRLLDPPARSIVARYLDVLAAGLPAVRTDAVVEVADGLVDAVHAYQRTGVPPELAARRAVAECGDPARLAAELAGELAATGARRLGRALVLTGPLVGSAWVTGYAVRDGVTWWAELHTVLTRVPLLPFVLAVTVPAAVLAVLGARARVVAGCAVLASGGCVLGDALLLGTATAAGWSWPVAAAAAVSVVRLSSVALAGRRCARLLAASG